MRTVVRRVFEGALFSGSSLLFPAARASANYSHRREPDMKQFKEAILTEFKSHFRGEVLLPGDPGYDDTRQVWNGMIDRKPALIARCKSAGDIALAVQFGREQELLVAVRGGGHNIAGNAVCDDGLMIDLSLMKKVEVDPEARRAMVEPGCILADFDAVAQQHGLATPLGINSTTGVAGLTLGGGFGWLEPEIRHDDRQPARR